MIGWTRMARVAGDPQAAMAFAIDMTQWIKKKYKNESAVCWLRVGGPAGQIVWQMRFKDMAELEQFNQKILADSDYWTRVKDARTQKLFENTAMEDGIWHQLA